jgi:hypothetical protein
MLKAFLISAAATTSFIALAFGASEFSYSQPRAMMALCNDLRHELGVLITYEDAPYEIESEVTSSVNVRNSSKVLTPKWKAVHFQLIPGTPDLVASTAKVQTPVSDDVLSTVEDLATQYNSSGNPGRFAAKKDGNYLHVQQTLWKNHGALTAFQPISETMLAWNSEPNSCFAVLSDLSRALSQARGFSIAQGVIPGALLKHHCDIKGSALTVNEALERILNKLDTDLATGKPATDYAYAWDLVYDPNWNKYFLSFVLVTGHAPNATTGPQAVPQSVVGNAGGRLAVRQDSQSR